MLRRRMLLYLTLYILFHSVEGSAQMFVDSRVTGVDGFASRAILVGSVSPRLEAFTDLGKAPADASMRGVAVHLALPADRQARLTKLLADQQSTGSSVYHGWITPDRYAQEFGMSGEDAAPLEAWLSSVGFSHVSLNRSHTVISFDGTVSTIEKAFETNIHKYDTGSQISLAAAADLTIPAMFAKLVDGIAHVGELPLKMNSRRLPARLSSSLASLPGEVSHFVSPGDIKRIYDFGPLYAAGLTGRNQSIAIVGQSAIHLDDINRFRQASGQESSAVKVTLVPDTGVESFRPGDEIESDIDIEYAGAIAPDADIYFVHTGSDNNHNAFDALSYAVDENIASIISVSYGVCEQDLSISELARYEQTLMQAAAQGQTVVVASGDLGSTECDSARRDNSGPAVAGLAVQYPASSSYVTAVGGTMFNESSGSEYWSRANASGDGEAISYIPERAWNESDTMGGQTLLGSGGGASKRISKPAWQKGLGVPDDAARDIPDLAIDAGLYHDGFVYCSSDVSSGTYNSCSSGFASFPDGTPSVAGGTSFGAPIIAGLIALTSQANKSSRLGPINASLYQAVTTRNDIFHDVTDGDNKQPCMRGSQDCSTGGKIGYAAGIGFDQVTGLGTPYASRFPIALTARPDAAFIPVDLTIQPSSKRIRKGQSTKVVISAASSAGIPTGSVRIEVDNAGTIDAALDMWGHATYLFSSSEVKLHSITAIYEGDEHYAPAEANASVEVLDSTGATNNNFVLDAQSLSGSKVGDARATITITPSGSYSGRVSFTAATSDRMLWQSGCYSLSDAQVRRAQTATTLLVVGRTPGECESLRSVPQLSIRSFYKNAPPSTTDSVHQVAVGNAGAGRYCASVNGAAALCSLALWGWRRRIRHNVLLAMTALALTVCCLGCVVVTTLPDAAVGVYDIVVTGTDVRDNHYAASVTAHVALN